MVNTPDILSELPAEFRPLSDRTRSGSSPDTFPLHGYNNPFSGTPERHIHRTYQSVQPERISQEYPGTGDIQEVCRSDQPLFIGFPHGDRRHNPGKKRKAH